MSSSSPPPSDRTPAGRSSVDLLTDVPVALCRINPQGQLFGANKAASRLLRRSVAQLDGQLLHRFGIDDAHRLTLQRCIEEATRRELYEVPQQWLSVDGDPVLVDLYFSRMPGHESASDAAGWMVALVDETRQHRENEALMQAHQALQTALATNQELALVADRSPNVIMICDGAQRIRWVNPSFTHHTGYTLAEARGRTPTELLGSPDTRPDTLALIQARLQHGDAIDRVHLGRRRKDGTVYTAEVSILPIRNDAGHITRHIMIEEDITDRLQAEIEREALMRAEASQAAHTEFLSRMSHNMRTPLNAVLGFSQLLKRSKAPPLSPLQQDQLQLIHQAGEQLLELVDQALQLARLEHSLEDYQPQSVTVGPLIDECVAMLHDRATARNTVLAIDADHVVAHADPQRLREILHTLVVNAIQYSPPGRTVLVTASIEPRHGQVLIAVHDEGVGISAQELPRLFQPFTRLESSAHMGPGHGIGLAISHRLAELMHGDLSVQSTPGQGSTFTLSLPAAGDPDDIPPISLMSEEPDPPELPPLSLLCVEDNAMNRLLIDAVFSTYPQVVVSMATTVAEARQSLRQITPDVVLLDINLPDGHGLDLCRALRADTALPQPLVVALSADALPEHIDHAMEAGVDHYLVKPLQIRRLLDILAEHRP